MRYTGLTELSGQEKAPELFYAAYDSAKEKHLLELLAKIDVSALAAAASEARHGMRCTVPALLPASDGAPNLDLVRSQMGGQNFHVDVEFGDGVVWLAPIRLDDPLLPPREVRDHVFESEVATLKFLEKTDVPAPRVHTYASESEAKLVGAPYVLMEKMRGVPLQWHEANPEQRSRVLAQMADVFVELERHPLPGWGSLCLGPDAVNVGGFAQPSLFSSPDKTLGPFDDVGEGLDAMVSQQQNKTVSGEISSLAEDNYLSFCWRKDMIPSVADHCRQHGGTTEFFLKHFDDKGNHVLVDAGFNITGIIDWEFASAEPQALAFSTPCMLWPVGEFYDGDNKLSAEEVGFAEIFEQRGRGDLARIVRESRKMQRFLFFNGGGVAHEMNEFRALFGGLRTAWKDDGEYMAAYDEWKSEAIMKYRKDPGMRGRTGILAHENQ